MAIKADIEKQRQELERNKRAYSESRFARKIFNTFTYIGAVSLTYLGIRALFGENLSQSLSVKSPQDLVQLIDGVCAAIGILTFPFGLATLGAYAEERGHKADVEREEEKLAEISEDYAFARGHV